MPGSRNDWFPTSSAKPLHIWGFHDFTKVHISTVLSIDGIFASYCQSGRGLDSNMVVYFY